MLRSVASFKVVKIEDVYMYTSTQSQPQQWMKVGVKLTSLPSGSHGNKFSNHSERAWVECRVDLGVVRTRKIQCPYLDFKPLPSSPMA